MDTVGTFERNRRIFRGSSAPAGNCAGRSASRAERADPAFFRNLFDGVGSFFCYIDESAFHGGGDDNGSHGGFVESNSCRRQ